MEQFYLFRQELGDALAHLHDPDYRPSSFLCDVLGCQVPQGVASLRPFLQQAIKRMEPPEGVSARARARRYHDLLHCRFALGLTQEQTAERMDTSVRTLRRQQRAAIHALAGLLWEHGRRRHAALEQNDGVIGRVLGESMVAEPTLLNWREQIRKEIAPLAADPTRRVALVPEIVAEAIELERDLAAGRGVGLCLREIPVSLTAVIHPSVLRQVTIMAIADLSALIPPGEIDIDVILRHDRIVIALFTSLPISGEMPSRDLIHELLATQGGSLEMEAAEDSTALRLCVPAAGEVTVLVIDDNPDSAHLYRRYTYGTRYRIVHAMEAQGVFQTMETDPPDLVVLDIILPDSDGWQVLARLRQNAATRSTPVVVCSIIREPHLASSLGAAVYLPKPVRQRDFIKALDQALTRAQGTGTTGPVNCASAC